MGGGGELKPCSVGGLTKVHLGAGHLVRLHDDGGSNKINTPAQGQHKTTSPLQD